MSYKRCMIKTKVKKIITEAGAERYVVDVPDVPTSVTVVRLGEDITYRLYLHEGEEVLAFIGYKVPMSQALKDFNKQMGLNWSDIKNDSDYTKHWPYTKADVKGSWVDGVDSSVYVPYDGPDKDEPVKFKYWEE